MRKPGWYWVKWENEHVEPGWAPSWWCEEQEAYWVDMEYLPDDEIVEQGPRVPEPGEEWRCVPVMPTETMLDVAVSHALNVRLGGDYNWTAYMRGVWARMLAAAPDP